MESTDLIDVSDVAEQFEDVTPQSIHEEETGARQTPSVEGPTISSLKDRFAALTIDFILLYIIYWFLMIAYRGVALENAAGPVPAWGLHGLIFHGLFLLVAFLYFFLFESVAYATPGKLICRLTVRSSDGNPPRITQCFVRNLIRPLDLLLLPTLIPSACMEWTGHRVRLGDALARTLVIRKYSSSRRQYALTLDMLASSSGRMLAFLIDLIVFTMLVVGYALLLSPEQPLFSMMLVVLFPIVCILYYVITEAWTKTSLGKWIFGYTITLEDGSSLDTASAVIRTLFRPFDYLPFGYIAMLISIRRQRPGDLAAGTVLSKVPRKWMALIGIGVMTAVAFSLLYAGLSNRSSFLSSSFKINFIPAFEIRSRQVSAVAPQATGIMTIGDFNFAEGQPENIKKPAIFKPGNTIFIVFTMNGGAKKNGKLWIQEDLIVRYPDGSEGLKLDNVIDFHDELKIPGPIEMVNNIDLPQDAVAGRYTVSIVLRDKNTGRQLNEQRFFYVSPSR